ncbi:hypothetical protein SAMN06296427_101369 [Moheibacter sediminis]|uniref:Uncharacterized protein n=2 Tax=Moheibacter sediminis TaxID=1434700 RepID=A0A1W1YHI5_9FLAO|nr:hypothetical protein SAMN06296427_101369 [Moheibacter sediminis]
MKNFLNLKLPKRIKKLPEHQIMEWFDLNKSKIFCSGDVDIFEDYIEWVYEKGNTVIKIHWNEIKNVYVSSETGSNNIYIESKDGTTINFYINNRENCRDKFFKYIRDFATMKGAHLNS